MGAFVSMHGDWFVAALALAFSILSFIVSSRTEARRQSEEARIAALEKASIEFQRLLGQKEEVGLTAAKIVSGNLVVSKENAPEVALNLVLAIVFERSGRALALVTHAIDVLKPKYREDLLNAYKVVGDSASHLVGLEIQNEMFSPDSLNDRLVVLKKILHIQNK